MNRALLFLTLLLGSAAFAQDVSNPQTNASRLTTGTVPSARGGAGTITGALKGNGAGVVSQAACADLSNAAASCATDATNATNLASGAVPAARMPALTGDVTTSAGAVATTIAPNAVTNAKAAQMANGTVKGRSTAGTGNAEDIEAGQLPATQTNNNACATCIGYYLSSIVGSTAISSAVDTNITFIDLLAGDWDVTGLIRYFPENTTTVTQLTSSISTTTATHNFAADRASTNFYSTALVGTGGVTVSSTLPTSRIPVSTTTRVYLVSTAVYGISSLTVSAGFLGARRAR